MKQTLLATVAACGLVAAWPALADSLTPTTFTASIGLGSSTSITNKVGIISKGTPTTALADVLFVTDTTGSMGAAIGAIQTNFSSILTSLSALGTISTGAAEYKDRTSDGGDAFDYKLDSNIGSKASTQAGINSWSAGGGGDNPEQGLNALSQAATTTAWQAGAAKIVVITGDAPSHSSGNSKPPTGASGSGNNAPAANGANVKNVAATLMSNGVTMLALNAGSTTGAFGGTGIGGDTDNGLNAYGQFSGTGSLLAKGVAGSYFNSNTTSTALVNDIVAAVGSAFASYSDVSLDIIGAAPTCVSVTLPSDITGSFTRATNNTFDFGSVGIKGTSSGTCSFTIGLEANGALLATESDTITVGSKVPEPTSMAVLGMGLLGLGGVWRRRKQI